ncbi:hypothetical protein NX059_003588 [Plenodomus lindquistii]|nr:hypothetical protein NX059_003588 [Plenodomus lindquistii]
MLVLLRLRCPLSPLRCTQSRTLQTSPKRIPTWKKRWNPTLLLGHDTRIPERTPDALDKIEGDANPPPSVAPMYGPGSRRVALDPRSVANLESILELAAADTSAPFLQAPLWLAYQKAIKADPKRLKHLESHVWDTLWLTLLHGVQAAVGEEAVRRQRHLDQVEKDMCRFEARLSSAVRSQQLLNLFMVRKSEAAAISLWEHDHQLYASNKSKIFPPQHLEVGVRLFAYRGDAHCSLQIMDHLFANYPEWDPSIMMAVFRAHTSSKASQDHETAKLLYTRMKEHKGEAVDLSDYTSWFVGFLEARHLPYAKLVFCHMVKEGHLVTTGDEEVVDQVLTKLNMLYRLGTDIAKMTSIALDALSILPLAYHNHVFGDWLKAAVVHKAPEAAGQILEMMYTRGTQPATFHFNMLLEALLRTQQRHHILKAENIGWQMIEEARKAHKRSQRPGLSTAEIINRDADKAHGNPKGIVRRVPSANVTTFALVMHHHAKALQWEHVDYLSRQLQESAVFPDATIMNVLIDNKCRQGRYTDAWGIYTMLTQPPKGEGGVFPNGATFRHLWKTLRLALGDEATKDDPNLPSPRELLKETVDWWRMTRSRHDASRFLQGLAASEKGAILALVLHCFSYTQDLAGSLVALHVLYHYFGIRPTDRAIDILQQQMSWVARGSEDLSPYFWDKYARRRAARVGKTYDYLVQQRLERMGLGSRGLNSLSDEQMAEFTLNTLSELVRVVLTRQYGPEISEQMIEVAKRVVGLGELPTGDVTAWEVV